MSKKNRVAGTYFKARTKKGFRDERNGMGFIQPMPDEDQEEYMKKTTNWIATITTVVALAGFVLLSVSAQAQTDGEALYKAKCAGCHGADGKGQTAVGKANNVRDLGSADVQAQSDDAIAGIISNGKGKMPAYGKSLKPDQIKDLVAYIRTLKK